MKQTIDLILNVAGVALFAGLVINFACRYGTRWEVGRYYLPRSLVAAGGQVYRDGADIDPINQAIIRADREEETILAILSIDAALLAFVIYLAPSAGSKQPASFMAAQRFRE
jgi:hypothetical protein